MGQEERVWYGGKRKESGRGMGSRGKSLVGGDEEGVWGGEGDTRKESRRVRGERELLEMNWPMREIEWMTMRGRRGT